MNKRQIKKENKRKEKAFNEVCFIIKKPTRYKGYRDVDLMLKKIVGE